MNEEIFTEMIHRPEDWTEIKRCISISEIIQSMMKKHPDGIPYNLFRQRLYNKIKWDLEKALKIIATLNGVIVTQRKSGVGRPGRIIIFPENLFQ